MVRTRHIPIRTCLACGQKLPQKELVRIVCTPSGAVEIDFRGRESGRGAYLCPKLDCWDEGLRKGNLDRVLRTPIGVEVKDMLKAQFKGQRELAVGKEAL